VGEPVVERPAERPHRVHLRRAGSERSDVGRTAGDRPAVVTVRSAGASGTRRCG
jgi:hypothetical protein